MPIDVLKEEARGLTNEQIDSVVVFIRELKKESHGDNSSQKDEFPLPPGYFSEHLIFIADDFDTYLPEGFEEYV